ncbi:MAG TPA: hypothetical protein VJL60_00605, partial [Gammaproteobacteria bacterium]|nr:hypothetical protein [Gammaproteobacteria bacterium]
MSRSHEHTKADFQPANDEDLAIRQSLLEQNHDLVSRRLILLNVLLTTAVPTLVSRFLLASGAPLHFVLQGLEKSISSYYQESLQQTVAGGQKKALQAFTAFVEKIKPIAQDVLPNILINKFGIEENFDMLLNMGEFMDNA